MRYGCGRFPLASSIRLILLACIGLAALNGAARAELIPDKVFNDWRTSSPHGNSTASVLWTVDLNEKNIQLQMGKFLGNCDTTIVYVMVNFPNPATKDYSRKDIAGEVRVDQSPVHKTISRADYKTGDKYGGYRVHSFENPKQLMDEMASGQTIRFRFSVDGQEYYFRFSLNGFKPAYDRVQQLCAQSASGAGQQAAKPKNAPPKPKAQKSDSDFFDTPKQPGSSAPKTGGNPPSKSDKDFF